MEEKGRSSKIDRLFKKMDERVRLAEKAWDKLYQRELAFDVAKNQLEVAGEWDSYCKARNWSTEANFHDMGA